MGKYKGPLVQIQNGEASFWNVTKGVLRLGQNYRFCTNSGRERGYVYFQDFIPGNDHDIRVIVIDGKAFAIKRLVREGDFRASGSGSVLYEKRHFDEKTIQLSFKLAGKFEKSMSCLTMCTTNGNPLIVEVSYGFIKEVYYQCEGYWDRELNWHPGPFDAQGWMVESMIKDITANQNTNSHKM
jgi:hypothetical protein